MTRTTYPQNSRVTVRPVELREVVKTYGHGENAVTALKNVTIGFPRGSFTAVMGPSGSGKSTLLQVAAGLDRPTGGSVHIEDVDLTELNETALTRLRRDRLGFVFQAFNLVPTLTVRQNVVLPFELAGRRPDEETLRSLLGRLGLAERMQHRPAQLSGGQQQRVAIARALLAEPAVIFADEPTGALDTKAAGEVLGLLRNAVVRSGRTIVMVTHDPVAASHADTVVFFADGQVMSVMPNPNPAAVAARMADLGKASGGGR